MTPVPPAIVLALLIAASAPPEGDTPPRPAAQEHFDALVAEIGSLRADLDRIDRREQGVLAEMDRLETEAALMSREIERLELLQREAERQHADAGLRLEATRREVGGAESALAGQLREAYTMGRQREIRILLALSEPVDLLRGLAYLDVMARRQSDVVDLLRRSRAEVEALERSLAVRTESLAALSVEKTSRARELEQVKARYGAMLRQTREQADVHRRAIAELTRAAEQLEAAIVANRGLLGHNDDDDQAEIGLPALDIGQLRGALEWPVEGSIKVPFGDIRHPRFGTVTPHPGVDIETSPRAPIRAVLGGRVAFSRRFSGYGNTVLLDHGDDTLSVYARAALLIVTEGQEVLPGQILGYGADAGFDDGAPTVYFEFRRKANALDPAIWLKRKADNRR